MKTKEEMNEIKEKADTLNKNNADLTKDELIEVTGGRGRRYAT